MSSSSTSTQHPRSFDLVKYGRLEAAAPAAGRHNLLLFAQFQRGTKRWKQQERWPSSPHGRGRGASGVQFWTANFLRCARWSRPRHHGSCCRRTCQCRGDLSHWPICFSAPAASSGTPCAGAIAPPPSLLPPRRGRIPIAILISSSARHSITIISLP